MHVLLFIYIDKYLYICALDIFVELVAKSGKYQKKFHIEKKLWTGYEYSKANKVDVTKLASVKLWYNFDRSMRRWKEREQQFSFDWVSDHLQLYFFLMPWCSKVTEYSTHKSCYSFISFYACYRVSICHNFFLHCAENFSRKWWF